VAKSKKKISPALHAGSKQSPIATSPAGAAKEAKKEFKRIPKRADQLA
jgi:hypothetical protein